MSKKYGTFSSDLLTTIGEATGFFTWPIEYSEGWRREQLKGYKRKHIYDTLHNLKAKGLVKELTKNGKLFIELTKKGQIEVLINKAHSPKALKTVWDGKWRLAIFDIPEDAKNQRDKLRKLLKANGFTMLQASVFISPYPLNREVIDYLKASELINFIRLARIDELDDDKKLRKIFKLV